MRFEVGPLRPGTVDLTLTPMPSPLGLESGTVRVVPSDPAWPSLFDAAAAGILAALGDLPISLDHVGSTAVPGLPAKPIIDILAGRPAGSAAEPYIAALEQAGYEHRGERGVPGRAFFRRGTPRAYHVHLFERGAAPWRDHLLFRDALRADPSLRAEYAAVKSALAERHPRDREAYTSGKEPFIVRVLQQGGPHR